VKAQTLRDWQRYAIVGIFALSVLFTPPDVGSQLAVAIPLLIFYEGLIQLMKWVERNRDGR
jgi:sec-independent protein translocase protein TatC